MLFVSFVVVCLARILFLPSRTTREKCTVTIVDFKHLQNAIYTQSLWLWDGLTIIMRLWVFPFFFITYLFFLLIEYTHLFNLHYNTIFLQIESSWLLWMTIASWIVSVFCKQEKRENRTVQIAWSGVWWMYCVISGICWMLGWYIVLSQISALTPHANSIATIVGIAFIIFGFLVIEEH